MAHLAALTDEQLKQEDRKSMGDMYKLLDSLYHAAKLPAASHSLDHFQLSMALKCLKTPYLEKRLTGGPPRLEPIRLIIVAIMLAFPVLVAA